MKITIKYLQKVITEEINEMCGDSLDPEILPDDKADAPEPIALPNPKALAQAFHSGGKTDRDTLAWLNELLMAILQPQGEGGHDHDEPDDGHGLGQFTVEL